MFVETSMAQSVLFLAGQVGRRRLCRVTKLPIDWIPATTCPCSTPPGCWPRWSERKKLRSCLIGTWFWVVMGTDLQQFRIECSSSYPCSTRFHMGFCSLSGRTSYRKISWCLEAARFGYRLFQSFWNLTGTSAAALPICLSNVRAIRSL